MSGNAPLCPCMFSVPTKYNDGRLVEPKTMLRIHKAMARQFEDFTVLNPAAMGTWQEQTEPSAWFLIAVPPARVEELKDFVMKVGKELGQKKMYFQAGPPSAWLLDID
jgi:hypothetical protein